MSKCHSAHSLGDWVLGCRPDQVEYFIAQLVLLGRGRGYSGSNGSTITNEVSPVVDLSGKILVSPSFSVSEGKALLVRTLECCQHYVENGNTRFLLSRLVSDRERFEHWPRGNVSSRRYPWPVVSRAVGVEVEDIVGGKVRFQALQSSRVRRNHIKRCLSGLGWSLPPFPWRVDCEDGRQYKLLKWSSENQMKQYGIVETTHALQNKKFVPSLVSSGENYLLVEFRSGTNIDTRTADFSRKFGVALAELHAHQAGILTREQILQIAESYLQEIEWRQPSSKGLLIKVRDRLLSLTPERVPTGTVYSDLKADNFLLDDQGELFFPDLGSFQLGQMLDVFLAGSPLFSSMCQSTFKETYLAAGGSEAVFQDNDWLKLLSALKMAEFFLRIHERFSVFNWRLKRNYSLWAKEKIDKLRVLAEED